MFKLAGDEIFHVLNFVESWEIVKIYSLVSKQWREESEKIPLRVKVNSTDRRRNLQQMESFRITELEWSSGLAKVFHTKSLSQLQLHHLTSLNASHEWGVHKTSLNLSLFIKSPFLKNLRILGLSSWQIEDADASILSQSSDLSNLTELDLSFTNIGEVGAFEILNNSTFTKLKSLNMKFCKFTIITVLRCLECLEKLNLESTNLIEVQVENNYLPNLRELNISKNSTLDVSFLKSFPKLENLNMDLVKVGEDFKDTLGYLTELKQFRIKKCQFTPTIIERISQLRNLTFLDLSNNLSCFRSIFSSDICTNITELNLDFCICLSEEECKLIGNGPALKNLLSLSMCYYSIGPNLLKHVIHGSNMSNLKTLRMESCNIGILGCTLISESTTLTQLTSLNLFDNSILDGGCRIICQTSNLQHLEYLNVSWNKLTTSSHIANNSYFSKLKELSFDNRINRLETDPLTDGYLIKTSPYLKKLKSINGRRQINTDN